MFTEVSADFWRSGNTFVIHYCMIWRVTVTPHYAAGSVMVALFHPVLILSGHLSPLDGGGCVARPVFLIKFQGHGDFKPRNI